MSNRHFEKNRKRFIKKYVYIVKCQMLVEHINVNVMNCVN